MRAANTLRRAAAIGLALIAAACSVTDPEGDEHSISGEAPATALDVYDLAEAWLLEHGYEVYERTSPLLLRSRRALPGADRRGRLDFTTEPAGAGATKYEIVTWTEVLGIQTRENDVEMQADAQSLSAALQCPQADWESCP